jgi:hypothetical protein
LNETAINNFDAIDEIWYFDRSISGELELSASDVQNRVQVAPISNQFRPQHLHSVTSTPTVSDLAARASRRRRSESEIMAAPTTAVAAPIQTQSMAPVMKLPFT